MPGRTVSIALDLFGDINGRASLMDFLHALGAGGFGPLHSGWHNDQQLQDAMVDAHQNGVPLELFSPECDESILTEGMNAIFANALPAGFSVRARIFDETPGGYRFKKDEGGRRMVVATQEHNKPQTFQMVGDDVAIRYGDVRRAVADGTFDALMADVKARSLADHDLPALTLSPDILEWLGVSDAPKP